MAFPGALFGSMQPSLSEVEAAIGKMHSIIDTKHLSKNHFYEMLAGFRTVQQNVQHKHPKAYEISKMWLRLYLRIQTTIGSNGDLFTQFEKTIPPAISYIIGCLQHKILENHSYYNEMLQMIQELVKDVHPAVVERLATIRTGVIACLWYPIEFGGDFNTQVLALRLMASLLKKMDPFRVQLELNSMHCAQTTDMRNKLNATIATVDNPAKFENMARELLNTYNMDMVQNGLVYSFRCERLTLYMKYEFFQPQNAQYFWIDLNHCPRTLTFTARYKAQYNTRYTNCSVLLNVCKISLVANKLTVMFSTPAVFSKVLRGVSFSDEIPKADLILPEDEAERLRANIFIQQQYNDHSQKNESPSEGRELSNIDATASISDNVSDKENIPPNSETNIIKNKSGRAGKSLCVYTEKYKLRQRKSIKTFQKHYNHNEGNSSTENEFIAASQSSSLTTTSVKMVPNEKATPPIITASFSIRKGDNHKEHPFGEKRRFFKTRRPTPDNDYIPYVCKKQCGNKRRKCMSRALHNKTVEQKQVIKVNPMTHKRNSKNGNSHTTCIREITNFLDNVNEGPTVFNKLRATSTTANIVKGNRSALVFNQVTRQTTVENPQRPCVANTAETALNKTSIIDSVYQHSDLSDVEPGQSYRNFKTRHLPKNPPEMKNNTRKRTRKTAKAKCKQISKDFLGAQGLIVATAFKTQDGSTKTRKRINLKTDIFDALKNEHTADGKLKSDSTIEHNKSNNQANNKTLKVTNKAIQKVADSNHQSVLHASQNIYEKDAQMDTTSDAVTLPQMHTASTKETGPNLNKQASQLNHDIDINSDGLPLSQKRIYQQNLPTLLYSKDSKDSDAEIEQCRSDVPSDTEHSIASPQLPDVISNLDYLQHADIATPGLNIYTPSTVKTGASLNTQASQLNHDTDINGDGLIPAKKRKYQQYNNNNIESDAEIEQCLRNVPINFFRMSPSKNNNEHSVASPQITNMVSASGYMQRSAIEAPRSIATKQSYVEDRSYSSKQFPSNDKVMDTENAEPNECVMYHVRSESDSNSDTDECYYSMDKFNFPKRSVKNSQNIRKSSLHPKTKCRVTTTTTSIVSEEVVVNGSVPPDTTVNALPAIEEPPNKLSKIAVCLGDVTAGGESVVANFRDQTTDDIPMTTTICEAESSHMLNMYKNTIRSQLMDIRERYKNKKIADYIKEVLDVAENIMSAAAREHEEISDLERNIESISRQLECRFEAYERKLRQFECFKQDIDTVVGELSKIDIKAMVETESNEVLQELKRSSVKLRNTQWSAFVKERTEELLKNLTLLSDI